MTRYIHLVPTKEISNIFILPSRDPEGIQPGSFKLKTIKDPKGKYITLKISTNIKLRSTGKIWFNIGFKKSFLTRLKVRPYFPYSTTGLTITSQIYRLSKRLQLPFMCIKSLDCFNDKGEIGFPSSQTMKETFKHLSLPYSLLNCKELSNSFKTLITSYKTSKKFLEEIDQSPFLSPLKREL